jgi:hypothetical protein
MPYGENLTMRSLTLTGAAMLMGTLLTGCGTESGSTVENATGAPLPRIRLAWPGASDAPSVSAC